MSAPDASLSGEDYCYLTTTGRVSSQPRTIEIWFALEGAVLYMLAGSREKAGWVKNLVKMPIVQVRIQDVTYDGIARLVTEASEDALARRLLVEKYAPRHHNELESWGRESLPVAVEFS